MNKLILRIIRKYLPVQIDFFNKKNNHFFSFSGPASGKMYILNALLLKEFLVKTNISILDNGHSYDHLSSIVEGKSVDVQDICFNFFSNLEELSIKNEEYIMNIIQSMSSYPAPEILLFIIRDVFNTFGKKANFENILYLLPNSDFKNELRAFGIDGIYGNYFNGENNFDLENDFSLYEFEEIDPNRTLHKTLISASIYSLYINYKDSLEKRIILIDESWEFLDSTFIQNSLLKLMQDLEKKNISIILSGLFSSFPGLNNVCNQGILFKRNYKRNHIGLQFSEKLYSYLENILPYRYLFSEFIILDDLKEDSFKKVSLINNPSLNFLISNHPTDVEKFGSNENRVKLAKKSFKEKSFIVDYLKKHNI